MKIVLATDLSRESEITIRKAFKYLENTDPENTEFLLVSNVNPIVPVADKPSLPVYSTEAVKHDLRRKMNDLMERIGSDINITPLLRRGSLQEAMNSVSEEFAPDLIVMGSKERGTFQRMTFGSKPASVAHKVSCPIFVIPTDESTEENFQLKHVVLATDFEPLDISNSSLDFIKSIAKRKDVKFSILHVFDTGEIEELREEMKDSALHRYLSDVEHEHVPVISQNIFAGIETYIDKEKPDCIVVIPRGDNVLHNIFHTGITEKVIHESSTATLLLN